jgi:hypothetical protein
MLLQSLLVFLSLRSQALPALGVAIPFFSDSNEEAVQGLSEDDKNNDEISVTVKERFRENVPLILRQDNYITTFESPATNDEPTLEENVMEDTAGSSDVPVPLLLQPLNERTQEHEAEAIDGNGENGDDPDNARQDKADHDDRGDSARIVNVQGQRRNPVYPGAGSRKTISLNRPQPIRIQDSYEPFQDSSFPSYQQQHHSQWSDRYIPPYSSPGVDRLLLGMIKAFLHYLNSKPKLRNGPVLPPYSEEEEYNEISIEASYTSDDSCSGAWWQWFSWFFCKIGL